MTFGTHEFEQCRVIEESAVDTTTVRTFEQYRLHDTSVVLFHFLADILQATEILDLANADTSGTARVFVRTELSKSIRHVLHFVLILEGSPFHTTVREVLIVVFALVVNSVEEVLEVVECDTANEGLVLRRQRQT